MVRKFYIIYIFSEVSSNTIQKNNVSITKNNVLIKNNYNPQINQSN